MCSFFLFNNYFSVKVNVPRNFQDIYKLHTFSVVWEESDSTENTTDGESMPFSVQQHITDKTLALKGKE